jgi:gluconolactonase
MSDALAPEAITPEPPVQQPKAEPTTDIWWADKAAELTTPPPLTAPPPIHASSFSSPTPDVRRGIHPAVLAGLFAVLLVAGATLAYVFIGSNAEEATPQLVDSTLSGGEGKPAPPPYVPPADLNTPAVSPSDPPKPETEAPNTPSERPVVTRYDLPAPEEGAPQTPAPPLVGPPAPVVSNAVEPPPAATAAPGSLVHKRRRQLGEEDLVRQIARATEVALDRTRTRVDSLNVIAQFRQAVQAGKQIDVAPLMAQKRLDLAGLPLAMGDECRMSPTLADHLQGGSVALRNHLRATASNGDPRPNPAALYDALTQAGDERNTWQIPEAIPALQQLLMAENESVRAVLIDQLDRIEGKEATIALAKRAVFDLHPDVRRKALVALQDRPTEVYMPILMKELRHPWLPVVEHATEALVALKLKQAVPRLVKLLDEPDPAVAYPIPEKNRYHVRELVRINHFRNCLLCHPPSFDQQDKVRGPVPSTDQPLTVARYYGSMGDHFVHADVTYLHQDFSVQLPVENHGPWPAVQRFDYVVRERIALPEEVAALRKQEGPQPPSEYQKVLFFGLRELTGVDAGPSPADWKRKQFGKIDEATPLPASFDRAAGLAVDDQGRLLVADLDRKLLYRMDAEGKPHMVLRLSTEFAALGWLKSGKVVACDPEGRLVTLDPKTQEVRVLAERGPDKQVEKPTYMTLDSQGGIYFSNLATETEGGSVYYLSAHGNLTRLSSMPQAPRGLALSPDEKTLYVVDTATRAVWAYPLESAGLPTAGKLIHQMEKSNLFESTVTNLAADRAGNLYVVQPSRRAIQILNREGAELGEIKFAEPPIACIAADGSTLYASTKTAVYRVTIR